MQSSSTSAMNKVIQMTPNFEPIVEVNQQQQLRKSNSASCASLVTTGHQQLNVNDLYAILKPVIKPYIFDPSLGYDGDNNKVSLFAALVYSYIIDYISSVDI